MDSFSWIRNTENILNNLDMSEVLLSRNVSSVKSLTEGVK